MKISLAGTHWDIIFVLWIVIFFVIRYYRFVCPGICHCHFLVIVFVMFCRFCCCCCCCDWFCVFFFHCFVGFLHFSIDFCPFSLVFFNCFVGFLYLFIGFLQLFNGFVAFRVNTYRND